MVMMELLIIPELAITMVIVSLITKGGGLMSGHRIHTRIQEAALPLSIFVVIQPKMGIFIKIAKILEIIMALAVKPLLLDTIIHFPW